MRREKAALSNGCESHPAIAAAGSNGAVMEVTKWLKPSVKRVTNYGDSASAQADPTTLSGKADTTGWMSDVVRPVAAPG